MVTVDTRTTKRVLRETFSPTCATSCTFGENEELHSWNSISIGHFVTASQLLIPLCNSECEVLFGRELYARVLAGVLREGKGSPQRAAFAICPERRLAPVPRLVSCLDSLLGIFAHSERGNSTLRLEKRGHDALRRSSTSIQLNEGRTPGIT